MSNNHKNNNNLNNKWTTKKLSNKYELLEHIGVGGMSYVYKARNITNNKIVAIKILRDELSIDEEFVNKFKTEALSSKNIIDTNVVQYLDVVDEGNLHYIVMEYLDGITLNKYIKNKGKLSNDETIDLSLQIAKGLKAAHEKGIIHRDIKPQNIVIDKNGVVKITDFGIARAITSTTKNISVVGTVHYISPEQVKNSTVDYRSDIYSLGCTMYEMITGVVPFEGETAIEIIVSHIRENLNKPSDKRNDIYPSLDKIIIKATRMLPRERYQNIDELIIDLEKAKIDKNGDYIENFDTDVDDQTVIISDEDMKIIKAVSERFTDKNYEELTANYVENEYINNKNYKQSVLLRKILLVLAILIILLAVTIIALNLDTKKVDTNINPNGYESIATKNSISKDISDSLIGINIVLAKSFAKNYDIEVIVENEDFNDEYEADCISKILKDDIDTDNKLYVEVSKGSYDIDFSDVKQLNKTTIEDLEKLLNDRNIKYQIVEINDTIVPRGYVVGTNKTSTKLSGDLIITVSRGVTNNIKTMPDLYNISLEDAKERLLANELILGQISYVRDFNVKENYVLRQSISRGLEVKSGTIVDLTVSVGRNGEEHIADKITKWHSEYNSTYIVNKNDVKNSDDTDSVIIQVRLMQTVGDDIEYTELLEAAEYKYGTIIPLIFGNIEGEPNIQFGYIQVVDVVNDTILSTNEIEFKP